MNAFEIRGGLHLRGEIVPQGAKNEALQVLCAVLLTDECVTLHNIPDIADVNTLIELLEDMGVRVTRIAPNSFTFQADKINPDYFTTPAFKKKIRQITRHCNAGRALAGTLQEGLYTTAWR